MRESLVNSQWWFIRTTHNFPYFITILNLYLTLQGANSFQLTVMTLQRQISKRYALYVILWRAMTNEGPNINSEILLIYERPCTFSVASLFQLFGQFPHGVPVS